MGQQVETGFESRSPTKNLDCRKADLRGEEKREAPPEASIRQFKPIPADCLPPRRFAIFMIFK